LKVAASTPAPAASTPAPASTPSAAPASNAPAPTTPSDSTPSTNNQPEANATPAPASSAAANAAPVKKVATVPITRIQLLAHNQTASWSVFAVSVIATVAIALFLLRHGIVWHRVLRKGEKFILKHKMLDIILVGIAVLGFLLTRTVAMIK